jgi:hypothetical protein
MAIAQDQQTTTRKRPTVGLLVAVGAVVFVLVIARWLTTPWDDWVPLDPHQDLPAEITVDDLPDAAHYRCSAVLDSDTATATDQALDAQRYQDLTREPCSGLRPQRKALGGLDVAVALAAVAGVVLVSRRSSGSSSVNRSANDPA